MIKRALIFAVSLFATLGFISTASAVEYVKICQLYGAGWNYIPGTQKCMNADTGLIRAIAEDGTVINVNSALAARVARLEAQLRQVYSQFGMQLPEEKQ